MRNEAGAFPGESECRTIKGGQVHTVREILLARRVIPRGAKELIGIFTFALLLTAGAFVYMPLPFTPVPLTMQVLFVLLAGVMLGARCGTLSVLLYITAGVTGLPVFAGAAGGGARILGPTGGYLLGFLLAPSIVAFLNARFRTGLITLVLALFAGVLVIYGCGVTHLAVFLHLPFREALRAGVYPFVLGDILKIAIAVYVVQLARRSPWNLRGSLKQ